MFFLLLFVFLYHLAMLGFIGSFYSVIVVVGKTTICRRLCSMLGGKQLCTPPKVMLGLREKFDSHPPELRRAYYALGNYLAASQVREVYRTSHVVMDRWETERNPGVRGKVLGGQVSSGLLPFTSYWQIISIFQTQLQL